MKRDDIQQPRNCACFNLRRAARKVTQAYDAALKPSGLLATQYSLLALLAEAAPPEGLAISELAERLGTDRTTLTRNLAVAERQGWLRVAVGADRRERRVQILPAGRGRLKAAQPHWRAAQESMRKKLGLGGFAELLALTRQIAD